MKTVVEKRTAHVRFRDGYTHKGINQELLASIGGEERIGLLVAALFGILLWDLNEDLNRLMVS